MVCVCILYVLLLLVGVGIVSVVNYACLKPFVQEHKKAALFLILSGILLLCFPLFYSAHKVTMWNKNHYYNLGTKYSGMIRKFLGDSMPSFIYFNLNSHAMCDLYPLGVIFMDASSDDIKKLNAKLPNPISFLFLKPQDKLFLQNQQDIINKQPIIDNWYTFHGVDTQNNVVVYK